MIKCALKPSVGDPDTAEGIKGFYDDMAIPADSFARAVIFAMEQPENMDVKEILYRPTAQEL